MSDPPSARSGPLRVGLIGFGAIGRALWSAIGEGRAGRAACPAILVRRGRAEPGVPLTADRDAFLAERLDAVVECAGHTAVRQHGAPALAAGADLIVTAVGALMDDALLARLAAAAGASGRRLIVPAAGIGALDMLGAAAVGGLSRVRVTVRKDPASWKGTAAEEICNLDALDAPAVLYSGPVREGARRYPSNVNISAAAALAGIGPDRTELVIIADPSIDSHVVALEAEGAFGRLRFEEDVLPSDKNRKTGRIVAMALTKTIRQLSAPVVVGA
jgi:aspartate dehydrogenase